MQHIMGARSLTYMLAWFCFFLLSGLRMCACFLIPLAFMDIFQDTISEVAWIYLLLMLSTFALVLFLCSFIGRARVAAQVVTYVQLVGMVIYLLVSSNDQQYNEIVLSITSLIPTVAFTYSAVGWTSMNHAYFWLLVDFFLYIALFLYADQVIPNEYGTNKHPLFCIKQLFRSQGRAPEERASLLSDADFSQEEASSARYDQPIHASTPPTVKIRTSASRLAISGQSMGYL